MKKNLIITISLLITFIGCKGQIDDTPESDLDLKSKYTLGLPEPSDLAFSFDKKSLWTVSDNSGKIYKISFDGTILKEIDIKEKNLEGISVISDKKIAVVCEEKKEVIVIDTSGNELKRKKLDISNDVNLGLEGITYNNNTEHFFIVNEKAPMLLVELDDNFDILKEKEMAFSTDLSGIFYEENENAFWIVSHESSLLAKFDSDFNLLVSYKIPLKQAEGVVVDYQNRLIYMVSDVDNELYVFYMK